MSACTGKGLYDLAMAGFEEVGAALAMLRNRSGLSQEELAAKMKLKRGNSVSAIETGNPRVSSIHRYLVALGRSPTELAAALAELSYDGHVEAEEVREVAPTDPIDQFALDFIATLLALVEEVKKRSPPR